jgi:hypothetical protein
MKSHQPNSEYKIPTEPTTTTITFSTVRFTEMPEEWIPAAQAITVQPSVRSTSSKSNKKFQNDAEKRTNIWQMEEKQDKDDKVKKVGGLAFNQQQTAGDGNSYPIPSYCTSFYFIFRLSKIKLFWALDCFVTPYPKFF